MRSILPQELLEVWERNLAQAPAVRAHSLLAAACPELTSDQIATLSIGQRDVRLLALREMLFGPELESVLNRPGCNERLELSFSTTELRSGSESQPQTEEVSLNVAGYNLRLRLPNGRDVLLAGSLADADERRGQLLKSCLLSAECNEVPIEADHLSAEVVEAATQKLAEADPLAEIRIKVLCPSCSHAWKAAFDIVEFLWAEVDAWADHILNEVHMLASAYGWSERDILTLSPTRRQFYLDMVGA